jgi:type II secretory pathway component PulJ
MSLQRHTRGFSLVEGLLSLFLISLIMVVISGLTSTLRRAHGVSDKKSKLFEAQGMAVHTIKEEVQAAVTISRPAGNSPDKLQARRFLSRHIVPNPSPARLVWPKPASSSAWVPKDNAHMGDVAVELLGEDLVHRAVDGTTRTLLQAKRFEARQTSPGFFEFTIELTTDNAATSTKLFLKVSRW